MTSLGDLLIQLLVLSAGYVIGAAAACMAARLAGLAPGPHPAVWLVLSLPLACVLLAEGFTGLWQGTPGTLGLGGLTAFAPMLLASALVCLAAVAAQELVGPFDAQFPRGTGRLVTVWIALAVACSILALGLWRYWPAPRARLW